MYSAALVDGYLMTLSSFHFTSSRFDDFAKVERKHLRELFAFLEEFVELEYLNYSLIDALNAAASVLDFLPHVFAAYQGKEAHLRWLAEHPDWTVPHFLQCIEVIVNDLREWRHHVALKNSEILPGNAHLADLSRHEDSRNFFYVYVKELSPSHVRFRHPLTLQQKKYVAHFSNKDLLGPDERDPIGGFRIFAPEDSSMHPGSIIEIRNGHHRLYELYRRYLMGLVDGNQLIIFSIQYR